jgi:hypothetical protein
VTTLVFHANDSRNVAITGSYTVDDSSKGLVVKTSHGPKYAAGGDHGHYTLSGLSFDDYLKVVGEVTDRGGHIIDLRPIQSKSSKP